jgi:hypothetical protein
VCHPVNLGSQPLGRLTLVRGKFIFRPHGSFIPLKNPILSLKKTRFAETKIFLVQILGKFRFLETKVGFDGKKKSVYRNQIFYKGQKKKLKR